VVGKTVAVGDELVDSGSRRAAAVAEPVTPPQVVGQDAAYRFASAGDLPTKRLGRRVYVVSAKLREHIETEDVNGC
jgi:hypothetical protein